MVWDLRSALLKKEEKESARLQDFAFRLRVRSFRLLAERLGGAAGAAIVDQLGIVSEEKLIALAIAADPMIERAALETTLAETRAEAQAQLIAAFGDPTPHRLA